MSSTEGAKSGGEGLWSRMERFLYSGEKKHVLVGFAIVGIVFGAPWYYRNRGKMLQSHQDYMEKADKARSERLSTGHSSAK